MDEWTQAFRDEEPPTPTVSPTELAILENVEQGLVEIVGQNDAGERIYRLTDAGRARARQLLDHPEAEPKGTTVSNETSIREAADLLDDALGPLNQALSALTMIADNYRRASEQPPAELAKAVGDAQAIQLAVAALRDDMEGVDL